MRQKEPLHSENAINRHAEVVMFDRGNVRLGSKADIEEGATDVRFTPESGHRLPQW